MKAREQGVLLEPDWSTNQYSLAEVLGGFVAALAIASLPSSPLLSVIITLPLLAFLRLAQSSLAAQTPLSSSANEY